ncbi:hypothetical protein LR48_Vigan09g056600 [Vigna angularis]|uniref:Uncharacterized protein n=1 Tax=Phaseolus angularis TaxID=3914 RepID=A0A0L9VAF2_PHAAN|nr:hypothetical protein LR48_Vigan09g056600 [Vigna angularis]
MGTQFYQSILNHWWEPHSSMDQSQFWQATRQFENQPQQQWQQQSSLSESLDDAFQRFLQNSICTQKSIEASCKRIGMHIGRIIKRLEDVEVNTEVNPREEGQVIVTKSDKIFYEEKIEKDEEKIEEKETERLSEKNKDIENEKEEVERQEEKKICVKMKKLSGKRKRKKKVREKRKRTRGRERDSYEKPRPHLKKYHRKEKDFERCMEIFKKLEIKVPMIETLQQGWPPHRARDSRLQYPKGRRRNKINLIPASSFPASMSNTSSLCMERGAGTRQ